MWPTLRHRMPLRWCSYVRAWRMPNLSPSNLTRLGACLASRRCRRRIAWGESDTGFSAHPAARLLATPPTRDRPGAVRRTTHRCHRGRHAQPGDRCRRCGHRRRHAAVHDDSRNQQCRDAQPTEDELEVARNTVSPSGTWPVVCRRGKTGSTPSD